MLKWICRTSARGVLLAVGLLTLGIGAAVDTDPRQDFSYSLSSKTGTLGERIRWMPIARVERILHDHLEGVDEGEIPAIAEHLLLLCRRFRFDPAFILALVHAESGFRADAQSPVGALGLMQIMPASAAVIARENGWKFRGALDLLDPRFNLTLGISYLANLRHRYQGRSPYFFVAAYNIGPARLDELLSRPRFRPVQTLKYYKEIQNLVPTLWGYPLGEELDGARTLGGGTHV